MDSNCTLATMNTVSEKEQFRQELSSLCRKVFPERAVDNLDLHQLTGLIEEHHPELHALIRQLIQALDVNEFIRQDHELRIKMRDVWDFQVRQGIERQQQLKQQIAKLAETL
jgi:hypothetical protein